MGWIFICSLPPPQHTHTRSDLLATLEVLIQRKSKFDYVIIETSGMADPGMSAHVCVCDPTSWFLSLHIVLMSMIYIHPIGPVASCLWVDDELESPLRLDGIVTVVDAKHIDRHLLHDCENDDDECHPEEAFRQICVADRILLNKTDLVSQTHLLRLESQLHELNGMARIQRTAYSKVDLDFVLGLDCYGIGGRGDPLSNLPSSSSSASSSSSRQQHEEEEKGKEEEEQQQQHYHHDGKNESHHHQHEHRGEVRTIAIIEEMEVETEWVKRWLGELLWHHMEDDEDRGEEAHGARREEKPKSEIYRMKGTLAVAGSDSIHILQVSMQ